MKNNIDVKGVADYLGIGLTKSYEIVNQPGFPSFRIGRKILVSFEDLKEWQRKQIEVNEQEKSRV